MKIFCPQSELAQHLGLVGRAVAARPTHPILANILLEADAQSGTISLTGFDLDLGIYTQLAAMVEEGGRTTLPARMFSDIVTRLPDEDVTIEITQDDRITLECGRQLQYQVQGAGAEEFPRLPGLPDGLVHVLPISELLTGIQRSLFAASTDESKQILNGVSIRAVDGGVEFVATDGHRLSFYSVDLLTGKESPARGDWTVTAVLPVRSLRELEKILAAQSASEVEVTFDEKQMIFQFPNQCLTTRLLNGRYPDYHQLLPKQFTNTADIDRKQLIAALERISVLASQKNHIVKLDFVGGDQSILTISVDAPDVGRGKESVAIQYRGSDLSAAFNVRYLLEGLKIIDATDVSFCLNGAVNPAILQPVGRQDYRYLIMPVSVRG